MSFGSPDRWMWLMVALPIIGFYILKTRLRRQNVSTLLFWEQVFEEKRQRRLWQNLRHWLSLLLQLAFVGLLTFALTDPLWQSQQESGQELILVVDNSASMQAADPETRQSRLQLAVQQAADVAKGLRAGDKIALITAGTTVRVVVGMTDFAPVIRDALDTIVPTDGPTLLTEAIEAARRLSDDPLRRRIVVFSDACTAMGPEVPTGEDLRWIQVGKSQDNVAITTCQVRRSTVDPIGYALLVEVSNFSDAPVQTRVKVELDESLVDVIPIEVAPEQPWSTTVQATSRAGGVLRVTIDADDALDVDNVAYATVAPKPFIPVDLTTAPDKDAFYLQRMLESIPLIQLQPQQKTATTLSVFSDSVPESLPDGPILIVAPVGDGPAIPSADDPDAPQVAAWKLGAKLDSPLIAKQEPDAPLLRHVQLQNTIFSGGRDVEVHPALGEATTLLETAEGARVLVAVERPQGRVLILAADLDDSDLPLRIAFPVMMTNAMNWFFRQSGDITPAIGTGQIASVPWQKPIGRQQTLQLISPDGHQQPLNVQRDKATVGPLALTGVYRIQIQPRVGRTNTGSGNTNAGNTKIDESDESQPQAGDADPNESSGVERRGELVAVNLANPVESDLRLPELSAQANRTPPAAGSPPWLLVVLAATGLIVSEWVLFNRRIVA